LHPCIQRFPEQLDAVVTKLVLPVYPGLGGDQGLVERGTGENQLKFVQGFKVLFVGCSDDDFTFVIILAL
jgi:hypothetical protein